MTQVVVDRHALDGLLREMVDLREAYAIEGGALALSKGEVMHLDPQDEVVTLACQAGLPIPGVLVPGTVPPPPPPYLGRLTAPTYRDPKGGGLRCTDCGKVVYANQRQAGKATEQIAARQPMRYYMGECGHYHLSRIREKNR